MRAFLFILLYSYGQAACSQDSVMLKVTKVGSMEDKTVFWLKPVMSKDDTSTIQLLNGDRVLIRKQKFTTVCDCVCRVGETKMVAKRDLVIINDSFTKNDF